MVFTGKPSTGCATCRSRRVKCDEKKPVCGNCIKSKRECLGYRDHEDLFFRNETTATELRVSRKERNRLANREWRPDVLQQSYAKSLATLPKSLGQDFEKLAMSYFMSQYVLTPKHRETGRGFMEYALPVYTSASSGSPIFASVSATALATLAYKERNAELLKRGRAMYVQACTALQAAIADPAASISNDTLMSVLLLTLFENISATRATMFRWTAHADGAIALVKHRGAAILNDPIGVHLYWAVMAINEVNHCIRCKPMEPFLDWTDLWSQPYNIDPKMSAGNRLTMMSARLPALRYGALKYMRAPMNKDVALKLMSLKAATMVFDDYLCTWPATLSQSFHYREVGVTGEQVGDPETWEHWPGPIHAYYDIFVANAHNNWRTDRILVNQIIINCCERLYPPEELDFAADYVRARDNIQQLANDIVSSVPCHLGRSEPTFDMAESVVFTTNDDVTSDRSTKLKPDPKTHQEISETLGGWFLCWHMVVCIGCVTLPKTQRRWLKGRLLAIGYRYGMGQALVMAMLGLAKDGGDDAFGRGLSVVDMNPLPYEPLPDISDAVASPEAFPEPESATFDGASRAHNFEKWKMEFQIEDENEHNLRPFWETTQEDNVVKTENLEGDEERTMHIFRQRLQRTIDPAYFSTDE